MLSGYLSIILHAHLPYIYHPESKEHLEERWLFESITECYIPILKVLENLARDGVDFRLTMSFSPTLMTMLSDSLLMKRYSNYLDTLIDLGHSEVRRTSRQPELQYLASFYLENLLQIRMVFQEDYGRNILNGFKFIHALGKLELIVTAATHGYLPLIHTREARRAQVAVAIDTFFKHFGFYPKGFWLPECGYVSGVEDLLHEKKISYFFVDEHGFLYARPKARYGAYAPISCSDSIAAFARDPQSSRQVWDRHTGFPGDYNYREFYRDIGYDLELEYIKPYLPDGEIRVDTGFKYYRITGEGLLAEKSLYSPEAARRKAAEHADNFIYHRQQHIWELQKRMLRPPLIVAPYDAELFGHWWYEGPQWLDFICRKIHYDQNVIRLVTPTEYLTSHPEAQTAELSLCSWGEGGYSLVWLNEKNDWMYRHLHRAEHKICELAVLKTDASDLEKRALNQAARNLLLAQSSDWAFIIHTGTAVQYARQRFENHMGNFNTLIDQVEKKQINEDLLAELEQTLNIFPDLDYRIFSRHARTSLNSLNGGDKTLSRRNRVLFLSWEYPPVTVGGLARHVHDLAHALVGLGDEVHVLTCPAAGQENYYFDQGVHVHRVRQGSVTAEDFLPWVEQLNQALIELGMRVDAQYGPFDLIHGHDWLIEYSGQRLRRYLRLPLLVTIHATEHGRNRGIYTELQRLIHNREGQLANEADLVITCSDYMAREVKNLFGLPENKVRAIPNGVNPENITQKKDFWVSYGEKRKKNARPTILFFGRLVPEKGVQVLIKAMPALLQTAPDAHVLVAGRGPYEDYLHELAAQLGVSEKVEFVGFVSDQGRNQLLEQGWVAAFPSLYEPFGIVALEAMAAGVPVVVSDTGGLGGIIEHGVDGYKAPAGREDLLAYYLGELLVNQKLAQEFCEKAWRKVLTLYDWHYIAAATRDAYAEVAKTKL